MSDNFDRHSVTIQLWVGRNSVPSIPLASELLAWYHYVIEGLEPESLITVTRNASELLEDLYEDDDD